MRGLLLLTSVAAMLAGCGVPPEEAGAACVDRAFVELRYGTLTAEQVVAALQLEGVGATRLPDPLGPANGVPAIVYSLSFPAAWTLRPGDVAAEVWGHHSEAENRTVVDVRYTGSTDPFETDIPARQLAAVNATAQHVEEALTRRLGVVPDESVADVRSYCGEPPGLPTLSAPPTNASA